MTAKIQNLWIVCAAAALVASLLGHMGIGLNGDHMDLMDQVSRLVAGGEPYIAYMDVNPPLIHLLYALPWLLASATGLSFAHALWLAAHALTLLVLICGWRILRASGHGARGSASILLAVALALQFISFQHQVFADREHLMLTFTAPWLLLCSPLAKFPAVSRRWRIAAALLAAVGFALKPYFLLFYALSVLYLRPSLKTPEPWIIPAFFLPYAAVTFLCFPAFFTQAAPLLWHTYADNAWPLDKRFAMAAHLLKTLLPLWLGAAAATLVAPSRKLLSYLCALTLAGLCSYMMNAGWYYTQYPFLAFAFLLSIAACAALMSALGPRASALLLLPLGLAACTAMLVAKPALDRALRDIQATQATGHPMAFMPPLPEAAAQLEKHLAPESRYLFLGTNMRSLSLQTERRLGVGRYDHLWPLKGLAQMREDPERKERYARLFPLMVNGITQDIVNAKPERIVVDISPNQMPLSYGFNIVAFLKADPGFAEAMQAYALEGRIDACQGPRQSVCAFNVYYRKIK